MNVTLDNYLVVKFFKYLGWILYLGLFITTIFFTREAMEKFLSGDTSITYHETNIDLHHPTITMCPHLTLVHRLSGEFYRYGMDFNITYTIIAENYLTNIDNLTLIIGENYLKMSEIKVYLKEIYTYFKGVCYSIKVIGKTDQKYTQLEVWNSHKRGFRFQFASEDNSYGVTWGSFKDGEVVAFDLFPGKYKYMELSPERYISLKCTQHSFYQQVGAKIMESDSSNCTLTCMLATFPNVEYPLCPYEVFQEWYKKNCTECDCSSNIIKCAIQSAEEDNDRLPFCNITQYKVIYEVNGDSGDNPELLHRNHSNIFLDYRFATLKTKVSKEYLIYDVIGMVGLVGGTLGLFIGFSFSNVLMFMIEYLQLLVLKICSRRSNAIDADDQVSQNAKLEREWAQKICQDGRRI